MTTAAEHSSTFDPRVNAIIRELETRRSAVAERVSYLLSLNGDGPDEAPIDIESLHSLAELLRRNQKLPDPRIGVKPDGLMQIEWFLNPDGILALTFLHDGLIRVYAAFDEPDSAAGCAPINDTLSAAEIDAAIQPYARWLPPR